MDPVKVWVGNLPSGVLEGTIEDAFAKYGKIKSVWVARKPAGFGFVVFEDPRDAEDAVKRMKENDHDWVVEHAKARDRHSDRGRSPPRRGGRRSSRSRSPPKRRRSPSYDRRDNRRSDRRRRSWSPRGRSRSPRRDRRDDRRRDRSLDRGKDRPRRDSRSRSPPLRRRARSPSRSPTPRRRFESPRQQGSPGRRSRSLSP